ncbi:Fibroblast growth factor receptor 2 [Schistosoma japonicum]|nr:Fibroblast growth factor receptor 2 [Schistosoma japonicum]
MSNTDIDDYEAPNFELIDELRLPDEESYNDTSSDDAYSDINDKKNTLDLSKLILTNYTQFQFYMLDFVACLSKDVTLLCQIPWALNQLEVWYSGLSSKQSKLLKIKHQIVYFDVEKDTTIQPDASNSTLYESLRNNEKGYALFDNTITLKLSNLSHKDSGLYICRNDVYYKKLMITVVNCSKSDYPCVHKRISDFHVLDFNSLINSAHFINAFDETIPHFTMCMIRKVQQQIRLTNLLHYQGFIQSLLPSILIWTILLITISSILLSLIYCIWVRRKSMQTVLTLPIDFLDKHAKSKRVDVFRKFNSLYSESTNVLKHKLLLHYSSSTSSSSSGADASLSSSTVYSRSTSSDISNNTDADTKRQITGILTTFSQRLLCQPTNFSSLEHSTLHCNMVLLEWLREYLTSKPKTYLPKSSFTLENVIGQGNYGMIYKGKLCTVHDNENNTEIAVKTLKISPLMIIFFTKSTTSNGPYGNF